ncbi:hypothetical protein GCM10023176_02260 [Micromonospora coerulea]|uniref:DNA-binding protein n=1 Tax=Micromonospora coerulea TaxID=47856 RepID=A0ABP8S6Q7_9ACTN
MKVTSAKLQAVKRPRLYGPGELAALFGVSRQRVLQITRRPGFPEPIPRQHSSEPRAQERPGLAAVGVGQLQPLVEPQPSQT